MEEEFEKYTGLFLQFPHLEYAKLKEKACRQIIHIISKSRLGQKMKFRSYGKFEVDETGQYATAQFLPNFTRFGTKCMIWEIGKAEKYGFDRLIMFMHTVHDNKYYDYLLYNTETKKSNGHFYKNPDISALQDINVPSNVLLTDLNISFNRMEKAKYMQEYISSKNRLLNKNA